MTIKLKECLFKNLLTAKTEIIPKINAETTPDIASTPVNPKEFFVNVFINFKRQTPAIGKIERIIENLKLLRRSYPK